MFSASNDEKFRELIYHTIFTSVVALLKQTKEIKDKEDKERRIQKDINKEQTNIEENDLNQEKVDEIGK